MSNFQLNQPLCRMESLIQLNTLSNIWLQLNETSPRSLATISWGRFIYPYSGTLEIEHEKEKLIAPTPYGIWLPPKLQNEKYIFKPKSYCTIFISEEFSNTLPSRKCTLLCTPIISSILDNFKYNQLTTKSFSSVQQVRLLQVLVDQMNDIKVSGSYLPSTNHPVLLEIIDYLERKNEQKISLNDLLHIFGLTKRTLYYYCQSELGMTLIEWRQRKKVIIAIRKLEEGKSIKHIAKHLHYSSSTAFVNMFRRLTNLNPDFFQSSK